MLSASAGVPSRDTARPWILAATILGSSMAFIDGTVVNVALPALQSTFHASVVDVQWVVEAYGVFLSALLLVGGALSDLFGRRRIFLIGIGVFAVASVACGLSGSIRQIISARCAQGMGAALLVPGSLAIIGAAFDEESRGQAIGTWSGFTAITTALGPVLGGWLVQYASWRWAFLLNVPLALAVIAISLRHVPESRGPEVRQVDWLGALLATAGLAGVITGFLESARLGWKNPVVYGSLFAGLVLLPAFLALEARLPSPMVPLKLFKSGSFLGANALTLFLYATLGIFFFLFPMCLIQLQHYPPTAAGAAMLPMILLMFLLSRWSGGLAQSYGGRIPLVIGPLIVAVGFILFAILLMSGSYWKTYFPAALVLGLGMAITVAPLTTTVMSSIDRQHAGIASGINNAVARVAGVLAIAVFGYVMVKVFDARLEPSLMNLQLPNHAVSELRSREIELAGLQPPRGLDANTSLAIRHAVSASFTSGFRVVLICCAGLSLASAAVAWRFLGPAAARESSAVPDRANERAYRGRIRP
jgi:EmrB/QacA subfamily drug resistance transporter